MSRFVGGPYDGRELEYEPTLLRLVVLPEPQDFDEAMVVRDDTGKHDWPHRYQADLSVIPPVYRYLQLTKSG